MGKTFERIDEHLREWIGRQALFFVGSAPLAADGHVNVSPKGPIGSLRVLDDRTVAYLDIVGSGAETIAHLRENGRIVVMLCAFEGPPRILRLHGRGEPAAAEARRSIVVVHVDRIADSCGYGVPLMAYEGEREHADKWAAKKLRVGGPDALRAYQRQKNSESLDGLPALEV